MEELISYKTAKLAKEKGFNVKVDFWIDSDSQLFYTNGAYNKAFHAQIVPSLCYCPSQAILQKWLREFHNIHVAILPKVTPSNEVVYYIYKSKAGKNEADTFKTYEGALEEALEQSLKLIKE